MPLLSAEEQQNIVAVLPKMKQGNSILIPVTEQESYGNFFAAFELLQKLIEGFDSNAVFTLAPVKEGIRIWRSE